ncbi:helix-turn-helix transcriptional regulator [Ramlibacter albus]|uniref:Helix-turn-helix transcriptional regulator n=1 Tax=Ramlibacter albus TaxID=2079448 RepID=A0A923S4L0_9BURK|nr:helix-turn-helix transcriptional regulator [Ramlibacter albus]MBC5767615.1 helix-turn-helix transcriptional regulator [Ramlibacter albus]
MDLPRQHRHQVDHRGESFLVCCERAGAAIRVWVERTSGTDRDRIVLADGHTHAPDSADVRNEFAILADNALGVAEEVAMSSGLFHRTGRSVQAGARLLAVWGFSSSSPLRIRAPGEADTRPVRDPFGLVGKDVHAVMRFFEESVRIFGVSGIAVTGPDVASDDPDRRTLVAASPQALGEVDPAYLVTNERRMHPAAEWGPLGDCPYVGALALAQFGFEVWISVRISLMDGHYYEVMMFGSATLSEGAHAQLAAATGFNMIAPLRRAAVASLKISSRELEVLRHGAMGVKETAELLGLTISTVKFHRDNIRRKIGGETTWQTYLRAQKLGVFD